jgi:hypothetical protein
VSLSIFYCFGAPESLHNTPEPPPTPPPQRPTFCRLAPGRRSTGGRLFYDYSYSLAAIVT